MKQIGLSLSKRGLHFNGVDVYLLVLKVLRLLILIQILRSCSFIWGASWNLVGTSTHDLLSICPLHHLRSLVLSCLRWWSTIMILPYLRLLWFVWDLKMLWSSSILTLSDIHLTLALHQFLSKNSALFILTVCVASRCAWSLPQMPLCRILLFAICNFLK